MSGETKLTTGEMDHVIDLGRLVKRQRGTSGLHELNDTIIAWLAHDDLRIATVSVPVDASPEKDAIP